MSRRLVAPLLLALVAPATWAAAPALVLEGGSSTTEPPTVRLVARNAGQGPLRAVDVEVVYQRQRFAGAPLDLAPGGHGEWTFVLPAPRGTGSFPVTVRARHDDTRSSVPLVVTVATPGAPPSPVRATLAVAPVAGHGAGQLTLENPSAHAVAGRVFFVLPGGLATDPESQAVAMPAGGRVALAVLVENRGLEGGLSLPAYAVFEHEDGESHHTVVAATTIEVVRGSASARSPALLIGLGFLAATLAVLAIALARRRA